MIDEFGVTQGVTWAQDGSTQPDVVNQDGVSFTQDLNAGVKYEGKDLDTRANKYALAGGFSFEEAKASLMSGEEGSLQARTAEIARMRNEAARTKLLEFGLAKEAALAKTELEDPDLAMEKEFAGVISSKIPSLLSTNVIEDFAKNPDALDRILTRSEEVLYKNEIFGSVAQKWLPQIKERTIAGSWANVFSNTDSIELFVPFLSQYRIADATKKSTFPEGASPSTASNIEEMVGQVYRLPPKEGIAKADEIVGRLMEGNAYDAMAFLAALQGYSSSDAAWDTVGDLSNFIMPATYKRMYQAVASSIKPYGVKLSGVAAATGNIPQASQYKVVEQFKDLLDASGSKVGVQEHLVKNAATIMNPESVLQGSKNIAPEHTARLIGEMQSNRDFLLEAWMKGLSVRRLDDASEALTIAYQQAEAAIRNRLGHISGSIMDVRYISPDVNLANVAAVEAKIGKNINVDITDEARTFNYIDGTTETKTVVKDNVPRIEVMNWVDGTVKTETIIGKLDTTFFDSLKQAEQHADLWYGFKKGTYTVREEAPGKYYISMIKQIDESSPAVNQALITEMRGVEPNDWASLILRRIGTPEELFSASMSANRKIAVHGTNDIIQAIGTRIQENFAGLSKDERAAFKTFITRQRDYQAGPDDLGKFSANVVEFENEWMQVHGRLPTLNETKAYWNYVQISDYDWLLRNVSEYTKLSQEGFGMIGLSTNKFKSKKPVFEGKIVDEIVPYQNYPVTITRWDPRGNHTAISLNDVQRLKTEGYKIVKLHSIGQRKLNSLTDLMEIPPNTKYILAREIQEAPLDWHRVSYNPGGHRVHTDDWFVSGEIVRAGDLVSRYLGDFNISSHMVRSQAQEMVNRLNEARELLRQNRGRELSTFIKDNFPSSLDEDKFRALFTKHGLNINESFKLRRKDTSLFDGYDLKARYKNLIRNRDDPHYADEGIEDTSFVGRREPNLPSYTFEGTDSNPLIRTGQSRLLDPLNTMTRSLSSVLKETYTDDLKIKHARDFIARYGDLLDVPSGRSAFDDPFRHATETAFKEGAADATRLQAAKSYREAVKNFLNIKPEVQTNVATFRERMLDTVYQRFGISAAEVAENYLPKRIDDPVKAVRSFAFNTKLGLFNPASFVTQVSQFTTTMAVAGPVRSAEALAWVQYARMMRTASGNPTLEKHLASLAGEWGGNASDFRDYYDALNRSGLMNLKGMNVMIDDDLPLQVTQSAIGRVLDWGRYPFDAGEKISRMVAFQIAFREHRAAIGNVRKITDEDIRKIVQRTDVLTSNMTKASSPVWQQGLTSIPTQFLSWHTRMTEQMLGNSLTRAEKTRLVLSNAVLYGIPAGLGSYGLASLVPWKDGIDAYMNHKGIDTKQNILYQTTVNGLVNQMNKYLLGDSFNPEQRFGPGKNPVLERVFQDEPLWSSLLGVASSTLQDAARVAVPAFSMIANRVMGVPSENDPGVVDFINEANKIVTSLSNAEKLMAVINTGKYVSKNDRVLAKDMEQWKGWVTFLTGLKPEAIVSAESKESYLNAVKGFQKTYEPTMLRYHNSMYEAGQRGDLQQMYEIEKKLKTLYTMTGMTHDEISKFEYKAFQNMNKSWIERVDQNLGKRNQEQYMRILKENATK